MSQITKREVCRTRPESTRGGRFYTPSVDIIEQPDKLLLVADVPGCTAADIDVNYDNGRLTITGRVAPRHADVRTYLIHEYGVADYSRTFEIGDGIDAQRIDAAVKDGVLTLQLPKHSAVQSRRVAVKSAN